MCYPVKCEQCGKTTWAGCGAHVASVKASVPPDSWCTCKNEQAGGPGGGGLLGKLFGR